MDYIFSKSKPEVGDKGFVVGDRFVKNFETSLKSITVNRGAYINTGIYFDRNNMDYCIEMKLSKGSYSFGFRYQMKPDKTWMGCEGNDTHVVVYSGVYNSNRHEFDINQSYVEDINVYKFDMLTGFYINDICLKSFRASSNIDFVVPLYIFVSWDFYGSKFEAFSSCIVYSIKISRSGNLLMDLIPYKKNSRYGMLDTLTGNFFASAGEVEFSK